MHGGYQELINTVISYGKFVIVLAVDKIGELYVHIQRWSRNL